MGQRGPLSSPERLRLLTGQRDHSKPINSMRTGRPRMPRNLPSSARREWSRVLPELERLGILSRLDSRGLADYCLCCIRLDECERDITERGLLVDGDRGKVKNPSAQLARQYRNELRQWCKAFGMTPDARDRMNIAEPDDAIDELESILSG